MTSNRTLLTVVVLAGWLALAPAASQATPLSTLFQGAVLTAGDKIFRDWTLVNQQVSDGLIDLTKIDVSPLVDDPLNPGVKYTAEFDALGTEFGHPGGAFARLRFSYVVQTIDGQPLIKDNSLLVNDWVFDAGPTANILISEIVRDSASIPLGSKVVVVVNGDVPNSGNPNHFDSVQFPPQSLVVAETFIDILGPGVNDGARLLMFEQRFSQVPEPSSVALAGLLALCGAAGACRRRW
jgi:hypothetical protein